MNQLDFLLEPSAQPHMVEAWEWATVTSISPLRIRIDGDSAPIAGSPASLVASENLAVNQRVWVKFQPSNAAFGQPGGRYVILGPSGLEGANVRGRLAGLEETAVRYATQGRVAQVGPVGDGEPSWRLERHRPTYKAWATMYLAGHASTSEWAVALKDDDVATATLRFTKNGLVHQDNAGANGSRAFAYSNDLAAAVTRIAALEAQLPQRGVAQLTIPASALTTGFVSVIFPRPFSGTPAVVASSGITSGAVAQVAVYVSGITATGFQLRVTTSVAPSSAVSAPVQWIAAIN